MSIKHLITGDKDIRELFLKGGTFFFIKAAGLVFSFLFMWFIARYYGAKANGLIAISFSVMLIGAIVPKLGFDLNLVRLMPVRKINKTLFSKALSLSLFLSLIFMTIVLFFREELARVFFGSNENLIYITFAAYCIPIVVFNEIGASVFRAEKRNAEFSFYKNVSRFFFGLIFLAGCYFIFKIYDINTPIRAYMAALAITAILITTGIVPIIKKKYNFDQDTSLKTFTIDSIPMMLSASIVLMMGWADTIILSIYEEQEIVGVYSVCVKLATLVSFALNSLNSILAPQISKFYHEGKTDKYQRLIRLVSQSNFYFSLLAILLLIVFRKYILMLFGPEFIIGATALTILCVGQFVNAFCGPVGVVLQMTGNHRVFKNFLLIALLLNIVLNVLLIPKLGMIGGAIGTVSALAFWNVSSAIYIKRHLKIKSYYSPFF